MSLREGLTARAEPSNPQRFVLDQEVTGIELDRWNEALDKAEAAPASAAHVTWQAGLADLDKSGDWVQTRDWGVVWRPKVEDTWKPYQNGRWRYFEALGYTWVGDDAWGWMPYHNGRWAHTDDLGWVWQPSVSTVFKPGEVYWLLGRPPGPSVAGWGALAPGELSGQASWPTAGPRHFAGGNTIYTAFQADARTLDPAGFKTPPAEQLRSAGFVAALPSPAFVAARLDATRPILNVGNTRIKPVVPGVTLDDTVAPPDAVMTAPPDQQSLPPTVVVSDAPPGGGGSLPDGVYPVPPVAVPVVEVPVVVNPPDHPPYSRRGGGAGLPGQPGSGGGQSGQGGQTGQTGAQAGSSAASQVIRNTSGQPVHEHAPPASQGSSGGGSATAPSSVTSHSNGAGPVHEHAPPATPPATTPPAAAPHEAPRVEAARPAPAKIENPKVESPKPDAAKPPDKKLQARVPAPGELDVYNQVIRENDPQAALRALNNWSARFPRSDYTDERQYLYIHVYNRLSQPEKVLEIAAPLVSTGVRTRFEDPGKVLQILFDSATSLQKLPHATAPQTATGQQAARQLLEFLPEYFAPKNKPVTVSDAAWQIAHTQLETSAKRVLAGAPLPLRAGN
jgi:hypothetical protein